MLVAGLLRLHFLEIHGRFKEKWSSEFKQRELSANQDKTEILGLQNKQGR